MKQIILIALFALLCFGGQTADAAALSEQQQQDMLEQVRYLRGEGPMPESFDESAPHRCGTELAFNFMINRGNFTGKFAAEAEFLDGRPVLPFSIVTPGGYCRIHYTTSGSNSVYLPNVDDNSDGIPDYVNKVAEIADSVWEFEVNHLGYPAPLPDDTNGGDSLKDIYITDMGSSYYGVTWPETSVPPRSVTSYIEIDNDFDIWPYNLSDEMEDRLDAARVTIAHEFFHTIHYTMDATEFETRGSIGYLAWWEMTAVWMEEMAYDDINDYYAYLVYYYNYPWLGLQHVVYPGNTIHQYGCAVFPMYLSEKFDTSIIKDAWDICAEQSGPQYLQALDEAILAKSGGEYDFYKAFNEFAVWNLFTGSNIDQAPVGHGFSEGIEYDMIPDSAMLNFPRYDYPQLIWEWPDTTNDGETILIGGDIPLSHYKNRMPQNAGANYINLQNLSLLTDSLFTFTFVGAQDIDWMASFVGFPSGGVGRAEILGSYQQPSPPPLYFSFDPSLYRNVIAVLTPVDTAISGYPGSYGYSPIFSLTNPDTSLTDSYIFSSPYPNPIEVRSDDDAVTFKTQIKTASTSGKQVKMTVSLFTVSGDKVNVRSFPIESEYGTYFNNDEIVIGWHLDNGGGEKVAPGVYLALCEVKSADGTIEGSEKFKIAVIR